VPHAPVKVTEAQTGESVTVATQSDGAFLAPQLLPGTYRVDVELAGFKHVSISGLKVNVGTTSSQDITLEPGGVMERWRSPATTTLLRLRPV
jgi:hypothetical protein